MVPLFECGGLCVVPGVIAIWVICFALILVAVLLLFMLCNRCCMILSIFVFVFCCEE